MSNCALAQENVPIEQHETPPNNHDVSQRPAFKHLIWVTRMGTEKRKALWYDSKVRGSTALDDTITVRCCSELLPLS